MTCKFQKKLLYHECSSVHLPYFKDNINKYAITYKDVLKSYVCVPKKLFKVQLIAFNINLNYNKFSFNCK